MSNPGVHKSKIWLLQKYYVEKLPLSEIANLAQVSERTIRRELEKHGFIYDK